MGMYQLFGNSYMREEVFMKPQRREKAYCLWPAQLVTMSLLKYVICLKASNFKLFILAYQHQFYKLKEESGLVKKNFICTFDRSCWQ